MKIRTMSLFSYWVFHVTRTGTELLSGIKHSFSTVKLLLQTTATDTTLEALECGKHFSSASVKGSIVARAVIQPPAGDQDELHAGS